MATHLIGAVIYNDVSKETEVRMNDNWHLLNPFLKPRIAGDMRYCVNRINDDADFAVSEERLRIEMREKEARQKLEEGKNEQD